MKKFELNVVNFDNEDVIVTSCDKLGYSLRSVNQYYLRDVVSGIDGADLPDCAYYTGPGAIEGQLANADEVPIGYKTNQGGQMHINNAETNGVVFHYDSVKGFYACKDGCNEAE